MVCSRCGQHKPWGEFHKSKGKIRTRGHCSMCKVCRSEKHRHPDALAAHRESSRKYRTEHPEKIAEARHRRRAMKNQAMPPWADRTEILSVFAVARLLRKVTGRPYHVDHIIPLKHPLVCGLHVPANLRVITRDDNLAKNNKFDPETFDADGIVGVQWAQLSGRPEALTQAVAELVMHATSCQK